MLWEEEEQEAVERLVEEKEEDERVETVDNLMYEGSVAEDNIPQTTALMVSPVSSPGLL